MSYKTEQEEFWAGEFGDAYIDRNQGLVARARNIAMFAKVLAHARDIKSIIEFGSNIGLNLEALRQLIPEAELTAVEINERAVSHLKKIENIDVHHSSILDFPLDSNYDFVLIKGVLIHINPKELEKVYEILHRASKRYVCIAEYYNPSPVQVTYRGHENRLFKRDFAGEFLDKFQEFQLLDYGFVYHRDHNFPQDDITWFLLEKS